MSQLKLSTSHFRVCLSKKLLTPTLQFSLRDQRSPLECHVVSILERNSLKSSPIKGSVEDIEVEYALVLVISVVSSDQLLS
jgi:hypothetical protein